MSRARRAGASALAALALACTSAGACVFIAPFPELAPDPPGGGGGAGGSDAGTGGGGGGEGQSSCVPRAQAACYGGPEGTAGVGRCRAGVATCNDDGTELGACDGEVLPGFEGCAAGEDTNCDGRTGCTGAPVQSVPLGGTGDQRGLAVAVGQRGDGHDDVLVAGRISGTAAFGQGVSEELGEIGHMDCFLASFTPDRRFGFSHRFADCVARGLAIAGSDVVLVGSASGDVDFGGGALAGGGDSGEDVVIARFDAAGRHLFSRRFGDDDSQSAAAVAVDAAGNAIVTGRFRGALDLGERRGGERVTLESRGGSDVFLAKLDAEGQLLWAKQLGDAEHQEGTGVAVDREGNILLVGSFVGTIDLVDAQIHGFAKSDMFIAKLTPEGDYVWALTASATNAAEAHGVAVDSIGNVFVTGSFRGAVTFGEQLRRNEGDADILLVRLDANGVPQWTQAFGDSRDQQAASVAIDLDGDVVVTGSFTGSVDFEGTAHPGAGGVDAFVVKLDPQGVHRWSRSFGDARDQEGAAVAVDLLGNSWVTGHFSGSIDLGNGALSSLGAADAFLVQIAP
ncbi:SBBP repeat-containing protein [Sorangium sp. So ce131]|uniref:SBBP repeat-containing protein n=1 Tax=Sorangium sp. So ce131 TaxID=3133282 RepID=UPI003F62CFD8